MEEIVSPGTKFKEWNYIDYVVHVPHTPNPNLSSRESELDIEWSQRTKRYFRGVFCHMKHLN